MDSPAPSAGLSAVEGGKENLERAPTLLLQLGAFAASPASPAAAASPPASARKRAAAVSPASFEWIERAASGEPKRHRGDSSSPAGPQQRQRPQQACGQPASVPSPAAPVLSLQHEQLTAAVKHGGAVQAGAPAAAAAAVPDAQQAAGPAAAQASEPGRAGLPDWCDRPLQGEHGEDAEPAPFCLLPGHPLLALACEGQAALLGRVLEQGADPDARDSRGLTALHMACRHARLPCVKALLEGGATQAPDRQGRPPVQEAAAAGHADVLAMIARHEEVQAELAARAQAAAERAAGGDS